MWAQCGVTSPEPKLSSGARALNCAGAAHVEPGEFRWPRQAARMSGQNPLVAPPHRCLRSDPYLPDPRFTSPTVSALGYRGNKFKRKMGRRTPPRRRGYGARNRSRVRISARVWQPAFYSGIKLSPRTDNCECTGLAHAIRSTATSPKLLRLNLLRELRALLRTELFLLAVFRQKLEYGKPKAG